MQMCIMFKIKTKISPPMSYKAAVLGSFIILPAYLLLLIAFECSLLQTEKINLIQIFIIKILGGLDMRLVPTTKMMQ